MSKRLKGSPFRDQLITPTFTYRWVTSEPFEQQALPGFGKSARPLRRRRRVMGEPQKAAKVHSGS
jgi:hypothetical protein